MNQYTYSVSDLIKLSELQYKKKPILMEFHTQWCPPCKGAHSIIEKEMRENSGKFILAQVNCDEAEQLNIQYQIEGVPTLILLNEKSQQMERVIGFDPKKIKQLIDKTIKRQNPK